jgi:hypothetical protein
MHAGMCHGELSVLNISPALRPEVKPMNALFHSIHNMTEIPPKSLGYDYIIISTNSPSEGRYWEKRLSATRGIVSNRDCIVFSIYEDWNLKEGAGNLLGTLYAWNEANRAFIEQSGKALIDELRSGKSIAMFHIAGLGTRMAPLPGAECNSKSAVKLPCLIPLGRESPAPLTILEAVILQTGPFAASRKGRLSVWWGDQVFIPSNYESPGTHHIEILARKAAVSKDLENYGLLLLGESGDGELREKMPLEKIKKALRSRTESSAGISLGSFSISCDFLGALLAEYAPELISRNARLNTDHDLWQPMTSSLEEYLDAGRPREIWERVNSFARRFRSMDHSGMRQFGYLDIGDSYWWDYGQTIRYQKNLLKILENSHEGEALRKFFGIDSYPLFIKDSEPGRASLSCSVLLGSSIESGLVENSIIVNSRLKQAHLSNSIVIESTVMGKIEGDYSLSYKDLEKGDLLLQRHEASAGIFIPPDHQMRMRLIMTDNGKENWRGRLLDNPCCFSDIWEMQKETERESQERFFNERRMQVASQGTAG